MDWTRKRLKSIHKPHLQHSLSTILFLLLILVSSLFIITFSSTITTCPDRSPCSVSLRAGLTYFKESKKSVEKMKMVSNEVREVKEIGVKRYLGGIGSSPPRCLWKCGNCVPCKPVHVPVPPGTPVTAEYYPEAWRCKCGNKLYMP